LIKKKIIITTIILLVFFSVSTIEMVLANPTVGVSPGNYVKYDNFTVNGVQAANFDYKWTEFEVVAVNGMKVTIIEHGQFNNGSAVPTDGDSSTYELDKTPNSGIVAIIQANLTQGDSLPDSTLKVVKTETRNYIGVNREVNIVENSVSTSDGSLLYTEIFDKNSGMLLELQITGTDSTENTSTLSFSVIETNIFSISASPSVPEFTPLAIIPLLIALISAAIVLKIKKPVSKQSSLYVAK
jgi:hypothetical protein